MGGGSTEGKWRSGARMVAEGKGVARMTGQAWVKVSKGGGKWRCGKCVDV
jgi:hypothetical protein